MALASKPARCLGTWPWLAALLVLAFICKSYLTPLTSGTNPLHAGVTKLTSPGSPGESHMRASTDGPIGVWAPETFSPRPVSPLIHHMVTQALEEYSLNPVSAPYNASGLRSGDRESCRDVQIIGGQLYYEHRGGKFPWKFMHFRYNMRLELISGVMRDIAEGGDVEFLLCQEVGIRVLH